MKHQNAVQTSHSDEKSSLTYEQLSRSVSLSVPPNSTSASFRELPVVRTLRFKLMRSKKNRKLHREIEQFCRVYNHFITVIERYYRLFKKHPSANRLKKLLPKLKRTRRFHWLKTLPSQALQDVVERIDRAYKRFFKERKKGRRCAHPHFKQPENYKSFTLKQAGWELVGEHSLRIGDFVFKFYKSREIPVEKVKTVHGEARQTRRNPRLFRCKVNGVRPETVRDRSKRRHRLWVRPILDTFGRNKRGRTDVFQARSAPYQATFTFDVAKNA